MTNLIILADIFAAVLLSSGITAFLLHRQSRDLKTEFHEIAVGLHERVDTLEAAASKHAADSAQLVRASHAALKTTLKDAAQQIQDHARAAKQEIKDHLDETRNDLKQEADRLRAHSMQMHDEAQTRLVSARVVPTRGQ